MLSSSGRVVAVLATLIAAWTVPRAPGSLAALGGRDLPAALAAVLELGLLALSCWIVLALSLAVVRGGPGRLGQRLLPAAVRVALLSGAVSLSVGTAAHASEAPWPVDGLRLPERVAVATADASAGDRSQVAQQHSVVVRSGDTLWSLSAQQHGADAPPSTVAATVRRIHESNRDRIGPDPDLIHPGQRLVVDEASATGDAR